MVAKREKQNLNRKNFEMKEEQPAKHNAVSLKQLNPFEIYLKYWSVKASGQNSQEENNDSSSKFQTIFQNQNTPLTLSLMEEENVRTVSHCFSH